MLPAPRMSAESSASRQHALRGSIAASSARTSSERVCWLVMPPESGGGGRSAHQTFELHHTALVRKAERSVGAEAVRGHDPMAGDEEWEAIVGAKGSGRPLCVGMAGQRGQLAVEDRCAEGDGPK